MKFSGHEAGAKNPDCIRIASLLPFYVCGEAEPEERVEISRHIAACPRCAAQLQEDETLHSVLRATPQPADDVQFSDSLLAGCRTQLAEAIDDLESPTAKSGWRPFTGVSRLFVQWPAWSAAAVLVLGFLLGSLASQSGGNRGVSDAGQVVRVRQPLTDEQLSKLSVAGIIFAPSPDSTPPTVQVQLQTEQPYVLSGSADDEGVRRVLTYVIENRKRFDAGLRLDCLEALRSAAGDEYVRRALLLAARHDDNPAVRLKALDALRDSAGAADVREALLQVLQQDANPGVRVEAVNLLVSSLQSESAGREEISPPDTPAIAAPSSGGTKLAGADDESAARVLRVLEDLMRRDPNRYVRLRSAAAVRQLGPRDMQ